MANTLLQEMYIHLDKEFSTLGVPSVQ